MNLPEDKPSQTQESQFEIVEYSGDGPTDRLDVVVTEEPLEIRLDCMTSSGPEQRPIAITMRTPGDDFDLTLGFLFSEGIIEATDVASDRIWRAYRRVTRHGRAIGPETPGEGLHDLRIDCKKLRYLLEFFDSLYVAEEIAPPIKELKRLQDNLGEFNDLEVQQTALRRFAHEMQRDGVDSVDCVLEMGRLVDYHGRRQQKVRRHFARCFARFDEPANRKRFRRLFKTPHG